MLPEELVEASAREAIFDPVPVRRCKRCNAWKPETSEHFRLAAGYLRRTCRECEKAQRNAHYRANRDRHRAATKERYERVKVDPEAYAVMRAQARERNRRRRARARHDAVTADLLREADRRYREKRNADPARRQAYLENRRIRETLNRRALGSVPVPQRSPLGDVVSREKVARLPVAPLRRFLAQELARSDAGFNTFAQQLGLESRTLARILRESSEVQRDVADRALTNTSCSLRDLYPELHEDAA
jgi:hypothetical protein